MQLKLLTWNLRYDSQPDSITVAQSLESLPDPMESAPFMGKRGEQPWSVRRIRVAQHIANQDVAVVALQEALLRQVNDLQELLGDEWTWVGVGRDDGKQGGEFNPIFYNMTKLKLVRDYETFWLSDTPFVPSRYPDAGSYRIATVAQFIFAAKDAPRFTLINTHLDERSESQRKLGASLILHRVRAEASLGAYPVFVVGDFNSEQKGRDSGAYQILTGTLPSNTSLPTDFTSWYDVSPPADTLLMRDLRGTTPRIAVSGYFRTFTGFQKPLGEESGGRIDYILGSAGAEGGWSSTRYITSEILFDDGVFTSDHRPVTAHVDIALIQKEQESTPA